MIKLSSGIPKEAHSLVRGPFVPLSGLGIALCAQSRGRTCPGHHRKVCVKQAGPEHSGLT